MDKDGLRQDSDRWYRVFRVLLYPVALSFRPKISGKENIPAKGPVIIACNHIGNTDPGYACMATKRWVHFMAKKELHENSLFGWFFDKAGTIPVDREHHGGEALPMAEEILNKGGVVGIYPEGTRNRTDKPLQPFKLGAVRLAQKTGAVIVPMSIRGKFRSGMKVSFGEGFRVSADEDLSEANEKLYSRILDLYSKQI